MVTSSLPVDDPPLLLESFLTGYWSRRTRANYRFIVGGWFAWCADHEHDPLVDADPRVIEGITDMQQRPYAANTITARVSAVSAFYRWCLREQLIDRNPIEATRRPSRPAESTPRA
jgi:site-specific recombinase XerD